MNVTHTPEASKKKKICGRPEIAGTVAHEASKNSEQLLACLFEVGGPIQPSVAFCLLQMAAILVASAT